MSNRSGGPGRIGAQTDQSPRPRSLPKDATRELDKQKEEVRARQDDLLDEALEESFPASDPLSSLIFTR